MTPFSSGHALAQCCLIKTLVICLCLSFTSTQAQLLHTESFVVILDTSRIIRGNIQPQFDYKNLKKDILEFENQSEILKA